jgi:YegS/Rv2252/BmrU family lipid kinase
MEMQKVFHVQPLKGLITFGTMVGQKRYFFIINPVSGKGKGSRLIPFIEDYCSTKKIIFEIHTSKFSGDACNLAEQAVSLGFDVIVAVGGDGTVNEVARKISRTESILGIIPIGSGNGLAREMKIPLDPISALKFLFTGSIQKIDTGISNGHFFACTTGVGFDAHLAHEFLNLSQRGLKGYVKLFLKEFFSYKNKKYVIQTDGQKVETEAFLITIANCRQWGNDFFISPESKYDDGKLEISIIRKFPKFIFPVLVYRIICKNIHKSIYFTSISSKSEISLYSESPSYFHVDGECFEWNGKLEISNYHGNLKVISER